MMGDNGVFTFLSFVFNLRTIHHILMTLLAGSQVSDRWPLGYWFDTSLFIFRVVFACCDIVVHHCPTIIMFYSHISVMPLLSFYSDFMLHAS